MKIFGINFGVNKNKFLNKAKVIEEEQEKLYGHHNRDFRLSIKHDKKAIIKYFIETETVAKKYHFQGKIHPSFLKELRKIAESQMSLFSEQEIVDTFYNLLRLNIPFKPTKKRYILYQKAYEKLIPDLGDLGFYVCLANEFEAFLLFQILKNKNNNKIYQTDYEDFVEIRKFIRKSWSYQSYPAIRENKEKLTPFIKNKLLIERVQKGFPIFLRSDRLCGAAITLLLLSTDEKSKNIIKNLNTNKLPKQIVGFLGSFYKDFQNNESNKKILASLYHKFPREWVDEHENRFKEMFG